MMIRTADFNPERTQRYLLTRSWNDNLPPCLFIMLNPSTADENHLDNTLTRCLDYTMRWKYGKMVVANIFALRSTDPSGLMDYPVPIGFSYNDYIILEAAQDVHHFGGIIICGWGSQPQLGKMVPDRANYVLEYLTEFPLYCLRVNKDGQPGHPLYLPKNLEPIPYQGVLTKTIQ